MDIENKETTNLSVLDTEDSLNVGEFQNICRMCLSSGTLKSVFASEDEQCKAVLEFLKTYVALEVTPQDGLPENVCSECTLEVKQLQVFVKMCKLSNEKLLRCVTSKTTLNFHIKVDDEFDRTDVEVGINYETQSEYAEINKQRSASKTKVPKRYKHKCKVCSKVVQSLSRHMRVHTKENYYKCHICQSTFNKLGNLKRHIKTHSHSQSLSTSSNQLEESYDCHVCPCSFSNSENLKCHLQTHFRQKSPLSHSHSEEQIDNSKKCDVQSKRMDMIKKKIIKPKTCIICSKVVFGGRLTQHMRIHTKEKPYTCILCQRSFAIMGNLKRHMKSHTGERPHVCNICGKGYIRLESLRLHLKTHEYKEKKDPVEQPFYSCPYCGLLFKLLNRYNTHKQVCKSENQADIQTSNPHDKYMENVCPICKRVFKSKDTLKTHQILHGEKKFLCVNCGKGFYTKTALESHFRVHTGEKPYTCDVCGKSFAHFSSLSVHSLTHTGTKPHRCPTCPKTFTQSAHLRRHLRVHTGARPFLCSYCNKPFAHKENLIVHLRIHTGETPYICPICGKGFYHLTTMKKHCRGHSGQNANRITKCK